MEGYQLEQSEKHVRSKSSYWALLSYDISEKAQKNHVSETEKGPPLQKNCRWSRS